jgi:hypothetical protein
MGAWVASGRVLDIILLGMGLEAVALVALWRIWHRGIRPSAVLPNLCSGMCLLVAMRVGLAGAWWGWISLPLLGALLGHVADLRLRWNPALQAETRRG